MDAKSVWHDLGMSSGLELSIVLTHMENLSISDQWKITVAYQEMIHNSLRCCKFRMSGKYIAAIRDLRTITGQSSKEERLREAPVIAEEGKHASMDQFKEPLPDFMEFSTSDPRIVHCKHSQRHDLDAV